MMNRTVSRGLTQRVIEGRGGGCPSAGIDSRRQAHGTLLVLVLTDDPGRG
jgi:hypothetical protein